MRKLLLAIASILLISCSQDSNRISDLALAKIKGDVTKVDEVSYFAERRFGEIEKVKLFYRTVREYDDLGMLIKEIEYNEWGEITGMEIRENPNDSICIKNIYNDEGKIKQKDIITCKDGLISKVEKIFYQDAIIGEPEIDYKEYINYYRANNKLDRVVFEKQGMKQFIEFEYLDSNDSYCARVKHYSGVEFKEILYFNAKKQKSKHIQFNHEYSIDFFDGAYDVSYHDYYNEEKNEIITEFEYDNHGNIINIRTNNEETPIIYTYDKIGNITKEIMGDFNITEYTYEYK